MPLLSCQLVLRTKRLAEKWTYHMVYCFEGGTKGWKTNLCSWYSELGPEASKVRDGRKQRSGCCSYAVKGSQFVCRSQNLYAGSPKGWGHCSFFIRCSSWKHGMATGALGGARVSSAGSSTTRSSTLQPTSSAPYNLPWLAVAH